MDASRDFYFYYLRTTSAGGGGGGGKGGAARLFFFPPVQQTTSGIGHRVNYVVFFGLATNALNVRNNLSTRVSFMDWLDTPSLFYGLNAYLVDRCV